MKRTIKLITFLLLLPLLITGCAKHKPQSLHYMPGNIHEQQQVEISTKTFSNLDCKTYLGTEKIVKKGYRPIQIMITNKSDKTFVLNGSNISIPLERGKQVARRCHYNTLARVAGWGVGGLFVWPLFLVAAAEGINSIKANKDMDLDFAQRSLYTSDQIVIAPHSSTNKIMFVTNENYRTHFTVDLVDKEGKDRLTFDM